MMQVLSANAAAIETTASVEPKLGRCWTADDASIILYINKKFMHPYLCIKKMTLNVSG